MLSSFTRFSESTEWRLQHGSSYGGNMFVHKQTSWFSYYQPLQDVKDQLQAWYGRVSGGGIPIVLVNLFGDEPKTELVPLPTWQLIKDIMILRDTGVGPNPFSPLAPHHMDMFRLQWRNRTPILRKSLSGLEPQTGLAVWQRDVGIYPSDVTNTVRAGFGFMSMKNNIVVVSTACKPDQNPEVLPRGG